MTFDLKAAREICSRIKGYEDPDGGNSADFQAAEMLPAALDEIERQAAQIGNLTVMRDALQARTANQANRIAELEAEVKTQKEYVLLISNIINLSPKDRWLTALDEAREQLRLEGKL